MKIDLLDWRFLKDFQTHCRTGQLTEMLPLPQLSCCWVIKLPLQLSAPDPHCQKHTWNTFTSIYGTTIRKHWIRKLPSQPLTPEPWSFCHICSSKWMPWTLPLSPYNSVLNHSFTQMHSTDWASIIYLSTGQKEAYKIQVCSFFSQQNKNKSEELLGEKIIQKLVSRL